MTYKERVPPVRVVAPSPSLLTSAFETRWDATAWVTGVEWMSDVCQPSYAEELCAPYGPDEARHDAEPRGRSTTVPFVAYTPMSCPWALAEHATKMEDSLRELHTARRSFMLARALWMGEGIPVTITDSQGDTVLPMTLRDAATDRSIGGTADDIDDVFSELLLAYEQATSGLGGATLHVPSAMIPALVESQLIRQEGNIYRGPLGSVVSPGPGYPTGASDAGADGAGPRTGANAYKGNALGEAWVYVTGLVEYTFGDLEIQPLDDDERRNRRTNTFEIWATQPAIVRFDDCSAFGALVASPAGDVS